MNSRFSKLSTTELVETHERLDTIAKDLAFAYDEIAMIRREYPHINSLALANIDIADNIALIDILKTDLENEIVISHTITDSEYDLLAAG